MVSILKKSFSSNNKIKKIMVSYTSDDEKKYYEFHGDKDNIINFDNIEISRTDPLEQGQPYKYLISVNGAGNASNWAFYVTGYSPIVGNTYEELVPLNLKAWGYSAEVSIIKIYTPTDTPAVGDVYYKSNGVPYKENELNIQGTKFSNTIASVENNYIGIDGSL